MKKLVIIFMLFASGAQAQNAFNDAMVLSRRLNGSKIDVDDSVMRVLDQYVDPEKVNTLLELKSAFNENSAGDPNPFIEIGGTVQDASKASGIMGGLGIGDLNVTNLADGLAQFLIERSKQELSIAFFERFKDDLEKFPELEVLFPNTTSFIKNIEAYNYASFLQILREAFHADLASLPTGMRNLRKLRVSDCPSDDSKCPGRIKSIQDFFSSKKRGGDELSVLFVATTIVMDSLQYGSSIPDILHAVAEDPQLDSFSTSNISNAFLLADIFAGSLRSKYPDKVWVTRNELKSLRNPAILNLYFGLVFQQIKTDKIQFITNKRTIKLDSVILANKAKLDKYLPYLENVSSTGAEINRFAKEIRRKRQANEKFTVDDYVGYLNSSVDAVKSLLNWEVLGVSPEPPQFEKIVSLTRSAISIYYNIRSDNYASAISNAFIIVDQTLSDKYPQKEKILRYGSFMASIVQAESADDVEKAIEAVALPAGSASMKKNSPLSIGLNAYLGAFIGQEYLTDKASENWGKTAGVAAPIGIAVSTRLWTASLTGFVSVLDLGAVASYRLDDENTEDLPELTLQNIFAPGFGVIAGVPKLPISIGYMYQLGPALREIESDVATISESQNKRWYFFVGVDIPLINFYTKPRKK
jgi:hypothetical protein